MGALAEESEARYQSIGDDWGMAFARWTQGLAALLTEDPAAPVLLADCLARFRAVGDPWGIAWAANSLGETARAAGDLPRAERLYAESLALSRAAGYANLAAVALQNLGFLAAGQGETRTALANLMEALTLYRRHGDSPGAPGCLAGLAVVAGLVRQSEVAARLFGAADALLARAGGTIEPLDRREILRGQAAVRERIGEAAFARAWAVGREMELDVAYAEAEVIAGAAPPAAFA